MCDNVGLRQEAPTERPASSNGKPSFYGRDANSGALRYSVVPSQRRGQAWRVPGVVNTNPACSVKRKSTVCTETRSTAGEMKGRGMDTDGQY
jgi:hypothetical protein